MKKPICPCGHVLDRHGSTGCTAQRSCGPSGTFRCDCRRPMNVIKERPILFRGEMVRAILEGSKTQTRRPIKLRPMKGREHEGMLQAPCPYGDVGGRLWVRESWKVWDYSMDEVCIEYVAGGEDLIFPKDGLGKKFIDSIHARANDGHSKRTRPSIFMPRWACRLELEVVKIRAERLREITDEDAKAEGIPKPVCSHPDCGPGSTCGSRSWRASFITRFQSMHKEDGAWNPLVWVIDFKRTQP